MPDAPTADYGGAMVETVREPLLVLDGAMRIREANAAFYQTFQTDASRPLGLELFAIEAGRWDDPDLRRLLQKILPGQAVVNGFHYEQDHPSIANAGRRARRQHEDSEKTPRGS